MKVIDLNFNDNTVVGKMGNKKLIKLEGPHVEALDLELPNKFRNPE